MRGSLRRVVGIDRRLRHPLGANIAPDRWVSLRRLRLPSRRELARIGLLAGSARIRLLAGSAWIGLLRGAHLLGIPIRPSLWRGHPRLPLGHAWLARRRPRLRLLLLHPRLPGRGQLARRGRRIWPLHRGNWPLLVRRDIWRGRALENGLAAPQQIKQPVLVDVEVAGEARIHAGSERELPGLELPEEVEGLPGAANSTAACMGERAGLEGVDPVAARLMKLENAGLAGVDNLVQEAEQVGAIDRVEGGRLGRGISFAFGEKLHTAVTGAGRPTLPSEAGRYNVLPARSRDRTSSSVTCGHSKKLPTA